jgi:hypothetical protein
LLLCFAATHLSLWCAWFALAEKCNGSFDGVIFIKQTDRHLNEGGTFASPPQLAEKCNGSFDGVIFIKQTDRHLNEGGTFASPPQHLSELCDCVLCDRPIQTMN